MSISIIDADRQGGALATKAVALIRYNTEAATPGNTTVSLRLGARAACVVDWGDGDLDFINADDFTQITVPPLSNISAPVFSYTRSYAAPGIYNAIVYSVAGSRLIFRSDRTDNSNTPNLTPQLWTRIEFPPNAFYVGWESLARFETYLTEVVFPVGQGVGFAASNCQNPFQGTAITALPRCSFSAPSTTIFRFAEGCTQLTNISTLLTTNTSLLSTIAFAFRGCTALTSFPAINLTGLGTGFSDAESTWQNCTAMTSFGAVTFPSTGGLRYFTRTWAGCTALTSFPLLDFSRVGQFTETWDQCTGLTSFPLIVTSAVTSILYTWRSCTGLTSFPLINTSAVTQFIATWQGCSALTSFPLINTGAATDFTAAWQNCTSLTSFPAINASTGVTFNATWANCRSLTSFPSITPSSGTNFESAWRDCRALTSFPLINISNARNIGYAWMDCSLLASFPLLDTALVTDIRSSWRRTTALTSFPALNFASVTLVGDPAFTNAGAWCGSGITAFPSVTFPSMTSARSGWRDCIALTTFPAGVFNGCSCTDFREAFNNCALDATSVNNILVSIESNGTSNGTLNMTGGTNAAPTGAGATAKTALQGRGWTVTTN